MLYVLDYFSNCTLECECPTSSCTSCQFSSSSNTSPYTSYWFLWETLSGLMTRSNYCKFGNYMHPYIVHVLPTGHTCPCSIAYVYKAILARINSLRQSTPIELETDVSYTLSRYLQEYCSKINFPFSKETKYRIYLRNWTIAVPPRTLAILKACYDLETTGIPQK